MALVGPYTLLRPLGEGGQGRVFEAARGTRRVALKLIDKNGPDRSERGVDLQRTRTLLARGQRR